MPNKKSKATTSLQELADKGVKKVKVTKAGEYVPAKAKATHKVIVSPGSVLVDPVKKWPKHKGGATAAYGPPRIADEQPEDTTWHLPIPPGATHAEYSTSKVSIAVELKHLADFRGMRGGTLRFGRLRYGDTFISMMPNEAYQSEPVLRADPLPPNVAKTKVSPAPKAPKPAAAPKTKPEPGICQNGVTRPTKGTTAQVWAICDAHKEDKAAAKAAAIAANINPSTFAVQASAWRKFHAV